MSVVLPSLHGWSEIGLSSTGSVTATRSDAVGVSSPGASTDDGFAEFLRQTKAGSSCDPPPSPTTQLHNGLSLYLPVEVPKLTLPGVHDPVLPGAAAHIPSLHTNVIIVPEPPIHFTSNPRQGERLPEGPSRRDPTTILP